MNRFLYPVRQFYNRRYKFVIIASIVVVTLLYFLPSHLFYGSSTTVIYGGKVGGFFINLLCTPYFLTEVLSRTSSEYLVGMTTIFLPLALYCAMIILLGLSFKYHKLIIGIPLGLIYFIYSQCECIGAIYGHSPVSIGSQA